MLSYMNFRLLVPKSVKYAPNLNTQKDCYLSSHFRGIQATYSLRLYSASINPSFSKLLPPRYANDTNRVPEVQQSQAKQYYQKPRTGGQIPRQKRRSSRIRPKAPPPIRAQKPKATTQKQKKGDSRRTLQTYNNELDKLLEETPQDENKLKTYFQSRFTKSSSPKQLASFLSGRVIKKKAAAAAVTLLGLLKELKIEPQVSLYTYQLMKLGTEDVDRMYSTYKELKQSGVVPNLHMEVTMVKHLGKNGDKLEELKEFVELSKCDHSLPYVEALIAFERFDRPEYFELTLRKLNQMCPQWRPVPEGITRLTIDYKLKRLHDLILERLYNKDFKAKNRKATLDFCVRGLGCILKVFALNGEWERFENFLQGLKTRNEPNLTSICSYVLKDTKAYSPMKILDIMKALKIAPQAPNYAVVIRSSTLDQAKFIWNKMKEENISPNPFAYKAMLEIASKEKDTELIKGLWEKIDADQSIGQKHRDQLKKQFSEEKLSKEATA